MAKKIPTDPQYKMAQRYDEVFSSKSGEMVLSDLRRLFFDRSSYVPGDPHGTAVRVGHQEVVLHIKYMLDLVNRPEVFTSAEEVED